MNKAVHPLKAEHPLKKASLTVLENWALMLVDEVLEVKPELFDSMQPVYMSWVSLHGPISGSVAIVAQKPFMQNLVRNVLGEDSEAESELEDTEDAYREMGNVLAGNFITEAYGADVAFDLLNPQIEEVPFEDLEKFVQRSIVFGFLADDAPVAVSFSIKKE